jgi:type I restriction enzyme S subunit
VRFGDVVGNVNDYYDRERDGVLPYVAGPQINEADALVGAWGFTSDDDFPPTFKRLFQPGDVLLHSRNISKVAAVDRRGVTGEKLFVLRSKDSTVLSQSFLVWMMRSGPMRKVAEDNFTGSVNKFLNWTPLSLAEFDLPPLDEQERISATLWAARMLSERLDARRLALATTRAVIRDRLFDREYPGATLEEVSRVASQNGLSKPKEGRSGPVAMVNMGQLFIGERVDLEGLEHVSLSADERDRFLLSPGDLLFARRSIVFEGAGLCCIFAGASHECTFESSVIRVTPDESRVIPEFLLHYFRSGVGRRSMSRIVRRGPVSGITGSDLRKMVVPAPPVDVQKAVIASIGQPDAAIGHSLAQETELRALASLLSRELLEGP